MKLVTYGYRGEVRSGVVVDDWVVDLGRAYEYIHKSSSSAKRDAELLLPPDLKQILRGGESSLAAAHEVVAAGHEELAHFHGEWEGGGRAVRLTDVCLWPPILEPDKVVCLGRNYRAHAEEAGQSVPEAPELFSKYKNSLIGHGWPIVLPPISSEVDYEAELAVVIGRRARNIAQEDALSCVAGYTIMHDVSARDYQLRTSQWLAGKSMDTFGPIGPWIVTADEITDPQDLQIRLNIGGEVLQDASTSTMVYPVKQAIAFISSVMTLEPGDIISTGTPEGVGMARTPPRYLRAGDTVDISIDKIGTLSNPVHRSSDS